jgi:hypothetical protein
MWSDGIFDNPVNPGGTVFENRAHMTTAKAMVVNTAYQYDFIGTGHDHSRYKQGWGMPDLQAMYDLRDEILVIDEDDVLEPFGNATYSVEVEAGAPFFKVTMTYADPPGNPSVQSQHRINDLDLTVTSPTGVVWYGNEGLMDTPWSIPGTSNDDKNTVENVFVLQPEAGTWRIDVDAVELIQDSHVETPELDADFALVASPIVRESAAIGPEEIPVRDGLRLAILPMGPGIPAAKIAFDLQHATAVRLRIFDVQGRLINTVHDARLDAGSHTLVWPGVDDAGKAVGNGVYFARLDAGQEHASGKVLIMR